MANLVDTANLTKTRHLTVEGLLFTEIPAIGDGNCGWYAFALGLIDLIKRDELKIDSATYKALRHAMTQSLPLLKERLKLYYDNPRHPSKVQGNPYTDLAPNLDNVIRFFESKDADTFQGFKAWIDEIPEGTYRFNIAALHVALGPALRKIAVDASLRDIEASRTKPSAERIKQLKELKEDGVDADQEILEYLAHEIFHINIDIYDDKRKKGHLKRTGLLNDIHSDARMSLVHVPGHWNFLLPQGEGGLDCLPSLVDEAPAMLAGEEKQLTDKKPLTQTALAEWSHSLQALSESLFTEEEPDSGMLMDVANHSDHVVRTVKQKLHITEESLKKVGLHEEAMQLVMAAGNTPLPHDLSTDEALARSLQNAEITAFLDSQYETLTAKKSPKKRRAAPESDQEKGADSYLPSFPKGD